jgi:glycine cleavage system aminomethyltransferase T
MLNYVGSLRAGFAETKEVRGSQVVTIANDADADYQKIRESVGIFPLTFASYYQVMGDEAEEVLDRLLTKSIQYLNYGQNGMCYFLDDAGEVLALVTVYKNDDNFLIETFDWDASRVEQSLSDSGARFEKLDQSCILLEGVSSADFMLAELGLAVDYFVYQSHQELDCFDQSVLVARTGYTGEYGYKLIGSAETVKRIWARILPEHKDKMTGYAAFELCQYEIKQPFWELPYLSLSKNVFEIDYHWLVDFKKDIDYIGKDALYNEQAPRLAKKLIGALSDKEATLGATVILKDEPIGEIADCKYSGSLGKYLSMLFVEKEFAHANIPLTTSDGLELMTASAPYVLPSSWSARP